MNDSTPPTKSLITVCFYLSGAAGLIYQVLWIRLLIPVVGAALHAVSTVLAAFMAGLALGSWLGGLWMDRQARDRGLRVYALLEFAIALTAALVPTGVLALKGIESGRLLGAFLLVFVPTFFMGATLPVLAKFVTERIDSLGERVGFLYSANTSGAVFGALAAGFFMVPMLGVRTSLWIAVALNFAVGLIALLLPEGEVGTDLSSDQDSAQRDAGGMAALLTFGFTGMVALGLEVTWTRALSQVLGTSIYAFSTMLVVFLIGIAAGSGLMATRTDGLARPALTLGAVVLGIGLAGVAACHGIGFLPQILFWAGPHLAGFSSYLCLHLLLASLILLPQTLLFGASLPVVTKLVTPRLENLGGRLGLAYFFNTVGGIIGSLLGGFLLVPSLGPQGAALALSGMTILVGLTWLWSQGYPKVGMGLSALALAFALALNPSQPHSTLFASYAAPGGLKHSTYQQHRERVLASEVLHSQHGLHASVIVSRTRDTLNLSLDGWVVASDDSGDSFIQRSLGIFPLLLARHPERVLVIGLGTGITAASAAAGSASEVVVAELEPAVVESAEYFPTPYRRWSKDPSVSIQAADGRNYVARSEKKFDVITSDPIHPFSRGSASLYTVEHFQACRDKLTDGGIMVQWLPLYGLSDQDVRIIVGSFVKVFPQASYWCWYPGSDKEDSLLVGSVEKLQLDPSVLQARLDELDQTDLPWRTSTEVLGGYLMEGRSLVTFAQGLPLNTDDRPLLEFTAPISIYRRTSHSARELARTIIKESSADLPPVTPLDESTARALAQRFRVTARSFKANRLEAEL